MNKVIDINGNEIEEYRFQLGSLFQFNKEKNSYIHVWKSAFDNTKDKAIKSYEDYLMNDEGDL